ncbi:MAG TPA: hypothetical protein VGE73_09610 [Pseudolabrys sp.]|jgi:hypothetical protein
MFRKIAIALVASSLIAGPVFAQTSTSTTTAPAAVSGKADVKTPAASVKTDAKVSAKPAAKVKHVKKAKKAKKHVSLKAHKAHHVAKLSKKAKKIQHRA